VQNGVDERHFRRRQPRPSDLPGSPVAVYVGTLHDTRIDVALIDELARSLADVNIALVGPDSLTLESRRLLRGSPNVFLLGPRPYADVPAYLQHADVIVVPHAVNPFTESLDPIKAYECLAAGTPTVATPVAGFRELGDAIRLAERDDFSAAVVSALANDGRPHASGIALSSWHDRAEQFERVLIEAVGGAR
jgi:teichuronic acid biosynthesis glycosyltransferase TuaH